MVEDTTLFFNRSSVLPFVEMRRAKQSSVCYQPHSHDEFSFGVIDAGSADYRTQHCKDFIGAKTTVLINPGDVHACNPKAGSWSYRMLFVDAHWVGKRQREISSKHGEDYVPFSRRYEQNLNTYIDFNMLFRSLIAETNALVAESQLLQFLQRSSLAEHDCNESNQLIPRGVQRAKEAIMDQLEVNLTLDDLVKHTELSRYHLIRSFKQAYGQPPHAYQLNQRINNSKRLLQKGKSVADTASALGFSDQSHFHRNFKKRLGITPKQYQSFFLADTA